MSSPGASARSGEQDDRVRRNEDDDPDQEAGSSSSSSAPQESGTTVGVQGQEIPLSSLSPQQLQQLHQQLKVEIQQLAQTMQSFHVAADRFRSSADCLEHLSDRAEAEGKTAAGADEAEAKANKKQKILVPLSNSVYMDGYVSKPNEVLVDVGTGYFCPKDVAGAKKILTERADGVQQNVAAVSQLMKKKQAIMEECEGRLMQYVRANAPSGSGASA
mmetsp:Transcript_18659/g.46586  ORF Transcript_18659/g.46586 Transcript_18659/m.46586 type:complete len:217 (-) Transcript_18659:217-867(-)|eukprot:g2914.t1